VLGFGSAIVLDKFCGAYHEDDWDTSHGQETHSYEHSREYESRSREVSNNDRDRCGPGGVNFWQFKKSSQERDSSGNFGWGSEDGMIRYGDFQRRPGPKRGLGKDKTNIVIQVPSALVKFFQKLKKPGGKSRGQPHKQYAPSFISYGPIYGPPPPSFQKGQDQKGWTQKPSTTGSFPPPNFNHRSSTTAATFQYGVPSQSPTSPSSPPPPRTTPFSHPSPTYGPTVRFQQSQPTARQNSHYSVPSQSPSRYKPPSDWDAVNWPTQQTPPQPAVIIQQSQPWSGPENQGQPPATYIPPTASSSPPAPGWASWDLKPTPKQWESPPRQNNKQGQRNGNRNEIPMNFGSPHHNFGPPHSSYGQPPPIIGTEPVNRYAPEGDIYTYPSTGQKNQQNQNRPQWQQQRSDHGDAHASASESEEFYINSRKPSTDVYQIPTKPYRQFHRRPEQDSRGQQPQFQDRNSFGNNQFNSHQNDDAGDRPNHNPNGRPPPNFDTNYNSPGMSKDPKIVDWMPYSAKNYHELPGKKKRSKPKYRTLPASMKNYQPDPEHEKYPKITYDSLSRRTLASPVSTVPVSPSQYIPERPLQSGRRHGAPRQRNQSSHRPFQEKGQAKAKTEELNEALRGV